MKRLLYVPIIHTSADLGSMAKDVAKRGKADLGEDIWKEHKKTVNAFWDAILDYFDSIDVHGVKIYQDGMIAEGEMGEKIVEETAKTGSKNYELILKLLKKGAILVGTEKFNLVKKERDILLAATQAKFIGQKIIAFMRYKLIKARLLSKRDSFIAKRIKETLTHGDTGILFIGAFHNIKNRLQKDMQIREVKDTEKVREYQRLLPFCNKTKNKERFKELGKYLVSRID